MLVCYVTTTIYINSKSFDGAILFTRPDGINLMRATFSFSMARDSYLIVDDDDDDDDDNGLYIYIHIYE